MPAPRHVLLFPHSLLLRILPGCKVDSVKPITAPDDARPDTALQSRKATA